MTVLVQPSSLNTTALDIIRGALKAIGVIEPGEDIDASTANDALRTLNDMLGMWSNQNMLVFNIDEIIFTLTPGQYTYTIGIGGDINTTRPLDIQSAYVRVAGIDYPVAVIDVNQYEQIGLKNLNGPWPRCLWYNAGVPLGTIKYWPNPNSGEMHMFAYRVFSEFSTINDQVLMPQGYNLALKWNLAEQLMPEYGKADETQVQMVIKNAALGRGSIKRTNMSPPYVAQFDNMLNPRKSKDAGWILRGGFY